MVYKNVGPDRFGEVLKEPVLFDWVTEQITKDREEKFSLIRNIIEELQPWLNPELYSAIKKSQQKRESKVRSIAKVNDIKQVEEVNAFDNFMQNLGIKKEDINGR